MNCSPNFLSLADRIHIQRGLLLHVWFKIWCIVCSEDALLHTLVVIIVFLSYCHLSISCSPLTFGVKKVFTPRKLLLTWYFLCFRVFSVIQWDRYVVKSLQIINTYTSLSGNNHATFKLTITLLPHCDAQFDLYELLPCDWLIKYLHLWAYALVFLIKCHVTLFLRQK